MINACVAGFGFICIIYISSCTYCFSQEPDAIVALKDSCNSDWSVSVGAIQGVKYDSTPPQFIQVGCDNQSQFEYYILPKMTISTYPDLMTLYNCNNEILESRYKIIRFSVRNRLMVRDSTNDEEDTNFAYKFPFLCNASLCSNNTWIPIANLHITSFKQLGGFKLRVLLKTQN